MKKFINVLLKILLSIFITPIAFIGGILYMIAVIVFGGTFFLICIPFYLVYCCVSDIWEIY